jgi:hypothetical protein
MSARQLIKLLLILSFTFLICYGLLLISDGTATTVFDEILTAFLVIAMLLSAMSVAMFTYLDNISKELTELRNEVKKPAYAIAHQKLSNLKKEVLHNGGLIVGLFLLERSIKGVSIYLLGHLSTDQAAQITYISTSLRVALFATSIWAATVQLKGFLVAVELQDVIANSRK